MPCPSFLGLTSHIHTHSVPVMLALLLSPQLASPQGMKALMWHVSAHRHPLTEASQEHSCTHPPKNPDLVTLFVFLAFITFDLILFICFLHSLFLSMRAAALFPALWSISHPIVIVIICFYCPQSCHNQPAFPCHWQGAALTPISPWFSP